MSTRIDKKFVLSDESVNRYGFRVMTSGIELEAFKKNPVMLWNHGRDSGSKLFGDNKPIGHWEDIAVEDDKLVAYPVFDCVDDLSKLICAKVQAGTISAASIGIIAKCTSKDKKHCVVGQTRETVLSCDLMEVSIVDIPANGNACQLLAPGTDVINLCFSETDIPSLLPLTSSMKLKETMTSLLSFFGIAKEKAAETEITDEQLALLDTEMATLCSDLDCKESQIATLSADHAAALAAKDDQIENLQAKIAELTQQVQNLKQSPVETPSLSPAKEPLASPTSDFDVLLKFAEEHPNDFAAITAKGVELGLFK